MKSCRSRKRRIKKMIAAARLLFTAVFRLFWEIIFWVNSWSEFSALRAAFCCQLFPVARSPRCLSFKCLNVSRTSWRLNAIILVHKLFLCISRKTLPRYCYDTQKLLASSQITVLKASADWCDGKFPHNFACVCNHNQCHTIMITDVEVTQVRNQDCGFYANLEGSISIHWTWINSKFMLINSFVWRMLF